MKQSKPLNRLAAFALAVCLLLTCTACNGGDSVQATTMYLIKTEGTVDVADLEGKAVAMIENLGLYSGYGVDTQSESYAWINLDNVKLTKMDEDSKIEILKEDKHLTIEVKSGALFFNVTEPLEDDETMDIRTSTMMVGIRGTCGWVEVSEDGNTMTLYLLEGTVECTVEDYSVTVHAGEKAVMSIDGRITVFTFEEKDIPAFVWEELEKDETLAQEILDVSGLDVRNPPKEADANEAAHAAYDRVLAQYLDAQQNALPYHEYDLDENYEINRANYPLLGPCWYYIGPEYPLYYAYHDLDGNGVEELFVAAERSAGNIGLQEIFAFNGTEAVPLSTEDRPGVDMIVWVYFSIVTADGLVIETGNGSTTSNREYRLSADGYSLEPVADSGVPGGVFAGDLDLSPYGGDLTATLTWTPLGSGGQETSAALNPADYVGSYICDETGITMFLDLDRNGDLQFSTPRPGDPSHLDVYTLELIDSAFQLVDWQTGETALILTPQDEGILIQAMGLYEELDYLSGQYSYTG